MIFTWKILLLSLWFVTFGFVVVVVALVFLLFDSCDEHTSLKLVPGLLME